MNQENLPLEERLLPDFYIENGLYIFTQSYHLKRGSCCKNGCRHCPWKSSPIDEHDALSNTSTSGQETPE